MSSKSASGVTHPVVSKTKESESVNALKRWHHAVVPLAEDLHHRKISGTSSEYSNESENESEYSGSNTDEGSANSDENDTVVSSDEGDSEDSRSNSDSMESADSEQRSRMASIGGVPVITTAPENLGQSNHWSSSGEANSKHSLDTRIPSDQPSSKNMYKASMPSFEEEEEDEPRHKNTHLLPPQSLQSKTVAPVQQQHHGLGHWKLPPLLKKIVYGSQESTFAAKAPAKESRPPTNSKPSQIPVTSATPSPQRSNLPIPVAKSKPSTANNLIHAVQKITSLGKNRVGSDPGLAKLSSSLGSNLHISNGTTLGGGSSKTLAADSKGSLSYGGGGTIWDDEDMARESETKMGLSDEDCFMAAKIRFEAKYKIQKQLGAGGHSTVRLAIRSYDNKPVVCKFIKNSSVWHWDECKITGRQRPLEIKVMRKFSNLNNGRGHPNLINYYEHFELNGKFMIIMEYMGENWIDLYDYIEEYGPVREDISMEIFRSIVETLVFLHSIGYYHNDIKDENVMIHSKTRQIKLIDFGSATPVPGPDDKTPNLCENFYGTKKFAAPEAVLGDPYNPEMQESWALGTLLFVLLFKLDPFTTDEEIMGTDILRRINKFRAMAAKNLAQRRAHPQGISELTGVLGDISDDAVEALCAMMEKDPTKRIKVKDILQLAAVKKSRKVRI
ncbi:hypothetical protein HDU99_001510 [Rhizoclosmatium hyalinum]|nr:hypothetical protein HDU99_001510 [Rhizoclosmatium hyalinum]